MIFFGWSCSFEWGIIILGADFCRIRKGYCEFMLKQFFKYIFQSIAGMIGISVYILADTFFISVHSGADGLAVLNLILPVYGVVYAIGAMIGIGSATRFGINRAKGENTDHYFLQSVFWSVLCSVPFIITGIFAPEKFLHLLGADAGLTALG